MKKVALAFAIALTLVASGTTAHAKKHLSGGGGTPTNYGYAIINGVFTTFVCTTTCTVISPDWLSGRTVVYTSSGWVLQ